MKPGSSEEIIWTAKQIVSGRMPNWSISDKTVVELARLIVEHENLLLLPEKLKAAGEVKFLKSEEPDPGGLY